jgi:NAD(P)-dependent dehydrogenase (short-subunit alcohol dehydrogenase family)
MSTAPRATPVDLTDQVALVTGGGRGLGHAFALALAAAGAKVAVMARTAAQLEATVQLIERAGGCALAIPGDVSVPAAVAHVVTTTEQQLGPVDLLVNNAGWYGPGSLGYTWEVDPEAWWHTFEINLRGPFLCARAVLPGMLQRHRGQCGPTVGGTVCLESGADALDALPGAGHAGAWDHGVRVRPGDGAHLQHRVPGHLTRRAAGPCRALPDAVQPGGRHPNRAVRADVVVPGLGQSGCVVRALHPCAGQRGGAGAARGGDSTGGSAHPHLTHLAKTGAGVRALETPCCVREWLSHIACDQMRQPDSKLNVLFGPFTTGTPRATIALFS